MIELPNWVGVAIAWLSAWWWEQGVSVHRGECVCNCTCETKVTGLDCPETTWSWEIAKAILLILFGILCATVKVISGVVTVFVKVIGLFAESWSATASTTPSAPPLASEADIGEVEQQRARALRQLAVVRERKALR